MGSSIALFPFSESDTKIVTSPQEEIFDTISLEYIWKAVDHTENSFGSEIFLDVSTEIIKTLNSRENREFLSQNLPQITAETFVLFCEREMEVIFSPKEKKELLSFLPSVFEKYPICSLSPEGDLSFLLSETYIDAMAKELMPYFVSKLARYYKIGIFLAWGNNKIREKVKKDLRTKNLQSAKSVFIKDFGVAFQKLLIEIKNTTPNIWEPTIGEYFTMIYTTFKNPDFREWMDTQDTSFLNLPFSQLTYQQNN